jgi:3-phosphoshikimate 1-carboxyvinyltransferase
MANQITVKKKIDSFNKTISVSGDKSLSIRWILFSSLANGKSKAFNLLLSDDVLATIKAMRKLRYKSHTKQKLLHCFW